MDQDEIIYKIAKWDKFLPLVFEYRKKLNIPKNGLSILVTSDELLLKKYKIRIKDNHVDNVHIRSFNELIGNTFGVNKKLLYRLDCFLIFSRNLDLFYKDTNEINLDAISGDYVNKKTNRLLEKGLILRIGPNATIQEIINFIRRHKDDIKVGQEIEYDIKPQKKKKYRKSIYVERDAKIYKLYKKSLIELKNISGSTHRGATKDLCIAAILKQEGITITDDNVRKVISRQKQLRDPSDI